MKRLNIILYNSSLKQCNQEARKWRLRSAHSSPPPANNRKFLVFSSNKSDLYLNSTLFLRDFLANTPLPPQSRVFRAVSECNNSVKNCFESVYFDDPLIYTDRILGPYKIDSEMQFD
jgi:hypothetical protein